MNRKVKFALLTLLGFSAACSTVRRASQKNGSEDAVVRAYAGDSTRRVIVMYGVRSPEIDSMRRQKIKELTQVNGPVTSGEDNSRFAKGKK